MFSASVRRNPKPRSNSRSKAVTLKLFAFEGAETDWVAASTEAEARTELMLHYGIGPDDVDGSYESISEVDRGRAEGL